VVFAKTQWRICRERVQYSLFECVLSLVLHEKMVDGIGKIDREKGGSVRVYSFCAACEKHVKIMGQGETSQIEKVYII